MEIRKGKLLNEGKAKKMYATNDPDRVIMHFKDDATAFDGDKKGTIKKKGEHNVAISTVLFKFLESYQIHTHFVQVLKPNEILVKKLEIIPVEVVMRNIAAGSLCKRYGIKEGELLTYPILELYLKDDSLHDPMINVDHACAFGYALPDEMQTIDRIARKINAVLKSFFSRRELQLVDFKLEFGRHDGDILLGDEISPDTCRFWDASTGEKLDKDRFRFELGNVEGAYEEVRSRICA